MRSRPRFCSRARRTGSTSWSSVRSWWYQFQLRKLRWRVRGRRAGQCPVHEWRTTAKTSGMVIMPGTNTFTCLNADKSAGFGRRPPILRGRQIARAHHGSTVKLGVNGNVAVDHEKAKYFVVHKFGYANCDGVYESGPLTVRPSMSNVDTIHESCARRRSGQTSHAYARSQGYFGSRKIVPLSAIPTVKHFQT